MKENKKREEKMRPPFGRGLVGPQLCCTFAQGGPVLALKLCSGLGQLCLANVCGCFPSDSEPDHATRLPAHRRALRFPLRPEEVAEHRKHS